MGGAEDSGSPCRLLGMPWIGRHVCRPPGSRPQRPAGPGPPRCAGERLGSDASLIGGGEVVPVLAGMLLRFDTDAWPLLVLVCMVDGVRFRAYAVGPACGRLLVDCLLQVFPLQVP